MSEVIDIKHVRSVTNTAKTKKIDQIDHSILTLNSYILKAAEKGMCGITIRVPENVVKHLSDLYTVAGYGVTVERDSKDTRIITLDWCIDYI